MSKEVIFKLNREGVRQLLRSSEMESVVKTYALEVQQRLKPGYSIDTFVGKNRVNASIYTSTSKAFFRNLHTNELLKALK